MRIVKPVQDDAESSGVDMTNAELVLDTKCIVGESLVWDDRRGWLIWVDMLGDTIHAYDPATGQHRCWNTPEMVTSIGLHEDGGAIVGLRKAVTRWDFGTRFDPIAIVEPDQPGIRLNEGVVGPDGAFWVGTMQDNVDEHYNPKPQTDDRGHIYRVDGTGNVQQLTNEAFGSVNTLVWTDGRLICADTPKNVIFSYRHDSAAGTLADRTEIQTGYPHGLPDGSVLDAENCIWNCRVVGGSRLLRMRADGKILSHEELPCTWPTSCAFGGKDLDELYVTSARFTMNAEHLERAPWEGGLFRLKTGVRGMPSNRFTG